MQSHVRTVFPIRNSKGHVANILGVFKTKQTFSTKDVIQLWNLLLWYFMDVKTINGFKTTFKAIHRNPRTRIKPPSQEISKLLIAVNEEVCVGCSYVFLHASTTTHC